MLRGIIIAVIVALVLAAVGAIYWYGRSDEKKDTIIKEAKTTEKVRKTFDNIDRKTPFGADKRAAAEFVRGFAAAQ